MVSWSWILRRRRRLARREAGLLGQGAERPARRGMKMRLGGSVRARAYGPAIRDRGLLWENADG
jgi:hypothetical protein